MGAGAILYYDGLQIYSHYEIDDDDNPVVGDLNVFLVDSYQFSRLDPNTDNIWDVNGDDKFVPIEFAGVIASVVFFVSGSDVQGMFPNVYTQLFLA